MSWFYSALIIGAWAFLWTDLLTQPSEIFDFVARYASEKIYKNGVTEFKKKIMKVLFICSKCHAGQLSLWSFFILNTEGYKPFIHFSFIVVAMITAFFLSLIYAKLK
jgi:hypothetical protein